MGTNGYFVFKYNGIYYAIYNHYDSYLSGLGKDLLNEIKSMLNENNFEEWLDKFKKLIILEDNSDLYNFDIKKISKKNIKKLKELAGNIDIDQYLYNIVNECKGSYIKTLDSGIIIPEIISENEEEIIYSSICIEYVYIFDFDEKAFTTIDKQKNDIKTYFLYLPKDLA